MPDCLDLMIGSFDRPELIVPDKHVWVSEKVAWDEVADGRLAFRQSANAGHTGTSGPKSDDRTAPEHSACDTELLICSQRCTWRTSKKACRSLYAPMRVAT
jgi:hypothetical protein